MHCDRIRKAAGMLPVSIIMVVFHNRRTILRQSRGYFCPGAIEDEGYGIKKVLAGERLHQVAFGRQLFKHRPGLIIVACGEHDDRDRIAAPDHPGRFDAIDPASEDHIHQDEIRAGIFPAAIDCFFPGRDRIRNPVSFTRQELHHFKGDKPLVLHDENNRRWFPTHSKSGKAKYKDEGFVTWPYSGSILRMNEPGQQP